MACNRKALVTSLVQDVQEGPRRANSNWLVFQGREIPQVQLYIDSFEKLHVGSFEKLPGGSFEKKKTGDGRIVPNAARRRVETGTCESEDRTKMPSTAHVVSLTLEDQRSFTTCPISHLPSRPTAHTGHSHMKRTATLPLLTSPSQGIAMYRTFMYTIVFFEFFMSVCSGCVCLFRSRPNGLVAHEFSP